MTTKKIYIYKNVLVKICHWCNGSGYDSYVQHTCSTCKGTGGKWKRVKILVREEVTK